MNINILRINIVYYIRSLIRIRVILVCDARIFRTWWKQSKAFLTWTARNSMMLAQGKLVSDVCIYYGDNTPNQAYLKHLIPGLGEGYDYDVTNTEVILNRMSVRNGRIVLPRMDSEPHTAYQPLATARGGFDQRRLKKPERQE